MKKSGLDIKDKKWSNLKIEKRKGTWYAVRVIQYGGATYLELENEQHGDQAEHIVINIDTLGEPSEDLGYHLLYEAK